MKLATTTGDLYRYCNDIYEVLDAFSDIGFRYLDMNLYGEFMAPTLRRADYRDEFARIREYAEKKGLTFVQSHAPSGNGLIKDDKYEDFILRTHRTLEACQILGIPTSVLHSGTDGAISMEEYFERNRDFYALFFDTMERTGVSLLIENSMPNNMKENTFFMYGREMADFLDRVGHPLLGACWDTGHANTFTDQYENISALGPRLRAVHIADNFGKTDDHIMPFQGTLNLDEVMCALLDNGFDGPFTFEAENLLRPWHAWPIYRKDWTPADGRARRLDSPSKDVRLSAERLMFSIGRQILTAYDCFEG